MEDFHSKNVTRNNLELIETLKEEIRRKDLRNKNLTKIYIIKSLSKNQATGYVKATVAPKDHYQNTAI